MLVERAEGSVPDAPLIELAGVDAERSRCGMASRAKVASTEGEGEPARCMGEVKVEAGGEDVISAGAVVVLSAMGW